MDIFVTRQPIFDDRERVVGYELLHRTAEQPALTQSVDPVAETSQLLSEHLLVEANSQLTGGYPAWVRFPSEMLLDGSPQLVPVNRLVVQIGGRTLSDEVVAVSAELAGLGYRLAAGPFHDPGVAERLIGLIDVLRVDFSATPVPERERISGRFAGRCRLLAEHVETREDQAAATSLGFELLQGNFLSQPATVTRRAVDRTQLGVLAAMDAISRHEMDFTEVEQAIKRDVALTDRLLRYINSAAFGWRNKITTIHQALVTLGERDVRRWVTVNALVAARRSSNRHLLVSALFRARMSERLAVLIAADVSPFDLFLTGMYSQMPALLGADMESTLKQVPLSEHVRDALLRHEGPLWQALQVVIAWESGDWDRVELACDQLGIRPGDLSECYTHAVNFADTATSPEGGPQPIDRATTAAR